MAKILSSLLSKYCLLQTVPRVSLNRTICVSSINMIKVGDKIPEALLQEGDPTNTVDITKFCAGKKVILFGVPGAFTPFCSKKHLPNFIENSSDLRARGTDEIICVSVNDAFVMAAWAKFAETEGKVRMFADPNAEFTKLMGLDVDIPALGGIRSKRYSMILEDNLVKHINVEPDGVGVSCTLAKYLPV